MGLLGKIGGVAKEAGRGALVNGVLKLTGNTAMSGQVQFPEYEYDANGHIKGVNSKYAANIGALYGSSHEGMNNIFGGFGGLGGGVNKRIEFTEAKGIDFPVKYNNVVNKNSYAANAQLVLEEPKADETEEEAKARNKRNEAAIVDYNNKFAKQPSTYGMLYNDKSTDSNIENHKINSNDSLSDIFKLKLPDWNYANFINERAIWQKGLSSVFDEPGWFYFKIFFDFNTNHGLFGGILNSEIFTQATNSAAKYLYTNVRNHKQIKIKDRINALYKFTSILSYITDNAPWYFKEVKNLNNAAIPVVDDFSQERSIEIEVTQDAIDMRLSTLMSLYNYACYDNFLNKEVIPANLRKFNMSIIVFQTPLRYLHTSFTSNKKLEFMGIDAGAVVDEVGSLFGKKKKKKPGSAYKSMLVGNGDSENFGDLMSMKIYTFLGCEFDSSSFTNILPGQMSNENPFQLGNGSIKITFTKCVEHTMNEFYGIMFGADGFYFNQYNNFQLINSASKNFDGYVNKNDETWAKQQERYQALRDTLDDLTQGGTILGLIDSPKSYKKAIDATEAVMNGLFDNGGMLKGLATNFALGLLGSSLNTDAPQGNIYGDVGIGSAYFKDKVEMLKNGTHEHTMAPYYHDPVTGVRVDLHVDKDYSSLDYRNLKTQVSNFNLNNFLQTNTQKFASKLNDYAREGVDKLFGYNNDFTEKPYLPNPYNSNSAIGIDGKKWEGKGKSHEMVDDPNTWTHTQKPNNKKGKQTDYTYDKNRQQKAINANLKENGFKLVGEAGKNQLMVDNPNTSTHVTSSFAYDAKKAVEYENSKAGGQYKVQDMVDGIGNAKYQFTMPPYSA